MAPNNLPVDFEERVKRPRPANGIGYPYQISARDLMANFRHLEKKLADIEAEVRESGYEDEVSTTIHPWKVTKIGNSSVRVGMGRLLTIRNQPSIVIGDVPLWTRLEQAAKYAGGKVSSISASGYIYGYTPLTVVEAMYSTDHTDGLSIERVVPVAPIKVAFSKTLPEQTGVVEEFCFVIAEVSVAAGVLTVKEQILTHNPTMWHISIPAMPG